MITLGIGFVIGLLVGWNFLSQPAFVRRFVDRMKEKVFG